MACYIAPRHVRPVSIFPRFPSHDLAPLFNLFDDSFSPRSQPLRSFQPRFDVREEKDAFHLQGELPGIVQKDVQIEFVDHNTLTIGGRTVRERTSGTKPTEAEPEKQGSIEAGQTNGEETRPSSSSSSYHKPTVEEEFVDVGSDNANAAATPASAVTEVAKSPSKEVEKKSEQASSKYWVSERSVGEFKRTFTFPGQVDQDAVKASLKDGILSVVVPKAVKESKKIVVE